MRPSLHARLRMTTCARVSNYNDVVLCYRFHMETSKLIATSELARRRGVTRQAISQAVRRGVLTPAQVLPNGNYLFTEDQAEPEAGES